MMLRTLSSAIPCVYSVFGELEGVYSTSPVFFLTDATIAFFFSINVDGLFSSSGHRCGVFKTVGVKMDRS